MTTTEAETRLLTPVEVAAMFRVNRKTVSHWAHAGRLPYIRTPGGKYRFHEADVHALYELDADATPQAVPPQLVRRPPFRPWISER